MKRGEAAQRSTFADVAAVAWYADAVNTAFRNRLIEGHNSLFRPNDRITRQELAVMVVRAAQFAGKSVEVVDAQSLRKYRDAGTVADWARREMALAVNWGIVSGTAQNRIEADGPATRAQAAVMLERMLRLVGFINAD